MRSRFICAMRMVYMRTQTTMVRTTIAKAGRKMARGMGSFPSAGGLSLSPSPLGRGVGVRVRRSRNGRSEEHTSELQSLMRISYAVFCLKKKKTRKDDNEKK